MAEGKKIEGKIEMEKEKEEQDWKFPGINPLTRKIDYMNIINCPLNERNELD